MNFLLGTHIFIRSQIEAKYLCAKKNYSLTCRVEIIFSIESKSG